MSGWALATLVSGGGIAALAIILWLTTRSHGKKVEKLNGEIAERDGTINVLSGARAQLTSQVRELEADRTLVVNAANDARVRFEKQIADLKTQAEEFKRRALAGASPAELRDMFDQMTGGKQS